MGVLRFEPKYPDFLSKARFHEYLGHLETAKKASKDHRVYWDLEENENLRDVIKSFVIVARVAGIGVSIRRVRGLRSLIFTFAGPGEAQPAGSRMSANESRRRILDCLAQAGEPLKKNQILKQTGISPSTWNLRIKEMIREGKVARTGVRRESTYTLA